MGLYNSIFQRKSCRKYDMNPLEQDVFGEMEQAIQGFKKLYSDVTLEHRFAAKVKGRFKADAPHYLVISGQNTPGQMEQTGFVYEQLVLWLDAREIGSVWLGSSRDADTMDTDRDIITIAFGRSPESVHRSSGQFKRERIEKISNATDDACVQAVHVAPSGMNTQPWYFEKQNDKVLVYKKRFKPPISLMYKLSDVDMGIGLCHYALACEEMGTGFSFVRQESLPEKSGYIPFGIVE